MLTVVLGSTSPVKRSAVEDALLKMKLSAEIHEVSADSGVNPQPVGQEEIKRGAFTRARAAQAQFSKAIAIGIENGIEQVSGVWKEYAVIVLLHGTRCSASDSEEINLPNDIVRDAKASGFKKTAGQFLAEKYGCDPADPHAFLTRGATNRRKILTEAIQQALTTFLAPQGCHH